MPTENIDLPLLGTVVQRNVRIAYLRKHDDPGEFSYIQGICSGRLKRFTDFENLQVSVDYRRNLPNFTSGLAELLKSPFDAVLSPPSRHPELAQPYFGALLPSSPKAVDLSGNFSRKSGSRSGDGRTYQEVFDGLSYDPKGCESALGSVLIVDDIFYSGNTAAAIIAHLQRAGTPAPCRFTVACPYWRQSVPVHAS